MQGAFWQSTGGGSSSGTSFWNQNPFGGAAGNDFWSPAPATPQDNPFWVQDDVFVTEGSIIVFDSNDHGGDGGIGIDDGYWDEAYNLYVHAMDLGYDVTRIDTFNSEELEAAISGSRIFLLPEDEARSEYPDFDVLETFVADGGTLVYFGNSSDNQYEQINDTFGFDFEYENYGSMQDLNISQLGNFSATEFSGNPSYLDDNDATDVLLLPSFYSSDSLQPIYLSTNDQTSALAIMPYEDGKVIFMGWDFYDDPDQNGGWDEAFSDVLEIGGAASTSTSQAFWETAGNDAQSNPFWVAGSPDLDGFFPDVL